MGKRGPAKTPTPILKLVGSHRAKSREEKEPKPKQAKPKTQIRLNSKERSVFNQIYELLKSMSLHASTDGNAVARYAKNVVLFNRLDEFCEKHGDAFMQYEYRGTERVPKGMKRYPQSFQKTECEMMLLRLEREFGLTPAARASLQVEKATDGNDIESKYLA